MAGLAALIPFAIAWALIGQYLGPWWCIGAVAVSVLGIFCLTAGR